ncbi:DUF4012 domain-containing protein [Herbiconiux sp. VKM Ac-1786]|uniref:DUF4012 domain-containing protein n=1 Tax=Herbiconiux sp. VKM Ac-1786 TaxID=2783824 RepID=UPI001889D333|nr:DUF4012 domain-containing protein [Herbiconiux sp. VKM Ac-1786]MBF4572947.1 DUF4012 domain-containing protein [Herbiconiux sp. VKM Ac-1786]
MSAFTVKNELEAARPLLSSVKDKVLDGKASTAQADVDELAEHATKAREASSGPAWWIAEQLPTVGANLVAVRTIADSVSDVVDNAVVPAVALGDTLSPAVFKPVDGAVNLAAINSVAPVLDSAGTALTGASQKISALDTSSLIGPVKNAVTEIDELVGEVEPAIATAKSLAPVLPDLLGANGPRNYLLVFENSAEVRPLGGIAGAQILVTADQGKVGITRQTTGRDFKFESEQFANSHVSAEARELYLPPFGVQSQNNTLTPRVEVAADLTRSMWASQLGVTPDTVIFVDPIALSYVLGATGPIDLPDGTQLTAENSNDVLLNQVYQTYSEDADAQDAYFAAAASMTFGSIMNGNVDIAKFVDAVQKSGAEQRMLASSIDETVQKLVTDAGLQGRMPEQSDDAHELGVYYSDYLGSKMDYYLRSTIQVGQQTCAAGNRVVRVQIAATNILDPASVPGLSTFITGAGGNGFRIPLGDLRVFTYVYAPPGSTIASITGSTDQTPALTGADEDYPVARGVIQAAPGETQTATIDIDVTDLPEKRIDTLVGPMLAQPEVSELAFTC